MTSTRPLQPQPSAVTGTGSSAVQLWQWWSAELKMMLPAAVTRWLDGDAVATNVSVDEHALAIINASADTAKPLPVTRVPIESLATNPLLRDFIAAGRDRVRLVLTPDQAMVTTISLPLATEENLRDVVGFELDRYTPFTTAQAYYDVQVVRRDPQQEKITVTLAVASKAEVATLLDTLRRAGLTCAAIGISTAAAGNASSFDLQPVSDKPPRKLSRAQQINLGLFGLAVLLGIAAIILPIWQKREAVRALVPEAGKVGAEFLISERVYGEYVKLAAEYNFLATRKHAVYPVLSVMEELAKTFPDTTWVQRLDIKANGKVREVTLMGEALSTSKVIENLEQSPLSLFQNSKQQSPTAPMQANTVRFHVSAEIKPRPVPTPEGLDEELALPVVSTVPVVTDLPTAANAVVVPLTSAQPQYVTPMQPASPAPNAPTDAAPAKSAPAGSGAALPPVSGAPTTSPPGTKEQVPAKRSGS